MRRGNSPSVFASVFVMALVLGLTCLSGGPAAAAWVWDGTTNTWGLDTWGGAGAPPALGNTSAELDFGSSTIGAAYTSTDDLAGAFTLNQLVLSSSDTSWANVIAASGANSLSFGGTAPTLTQSGLGAFTISAPIALGATTNIAGLGTGLVTLSGLISGTGGLTLNGAGTLALTNAVANTFSGPITINSGVLSVARDNLLGTNATAAAITLNGGTLKVAAGGQTLTPSRGITIGANGGTIDLTAGGTTTYTTGTFSGSSAVGLNINFGTAGGQFTTATTTPWSYGGPVTITGTGTFFTNVSSGYAFAPTTVLSLVDTGTKLNINKNITITLAGLQGAGTVNSDNGSSRTTLNVNNSSNYSFSGPIGTTGKTNFGFAKTGTGSLTLSGALAFTSGNDNTTYNTVPGAAKYMYVGGGTLILANPAGNTYTATNGTLVTGSSSSATATLIARNTSGSATGGTTATATSAVTVGNWGILSTDTGGFVSGPVTLQANGAFGGTNGATLTLNNIANGLTLPSGTTYGIFNLPGSTGTASTLSLVNVPSSFTLNASAAVTVNVVSQDTLGHTLAQGNYHLLQLPAALSTPQFGQFSMATSGLPSGYTYTLSNNIALKSLDLNVLQQTVAISWNTNANGNWDTTTANWNGATYYADGAQVTFDDTATGTHTVAIAGTVKPNSLTVNTAAGYTFGGGTIAEGLVPLALNKNGSGTLTLNNTNTLTGATTITGGTVAVGATGTLNSASITVNPSTALTVAGALTNAGVVVSNAGAVTFTNASQTLATLSGAGSVTLTGNALTLGSGTLSGPVGGTGGSLTTTGAVTLSNSTGNTYTNGTTVNAGSVLTINNASGSATGTGNVTVAGTLAGSGLINGGSSVNVQSMGAITPHLTAGTIGSITIAAPLTLSDGSTLNYNLGSAGMDFIQVSNNNNLTLTSGFDTLNVTALAGANPGFYKLIGFGSGTLSNNAIWVVNGSAGWTFNVLAPSDLNGVAGQLTLQAIVPNLTWTGTGNGNWNTTDTNNWKDTMGGAATYLDPADVTFDDTSGRNTIAVTGGGVNPHSVTFSNASATYSFSGGPIGGTGGIVLNGAGTVVLNALNGYTGGTTLNAGRLQISNDNQLGATAGGITFGGTGATLAVTTTTTSARGVTLGGSTNAAFDVANLQTFTLNGVIGGSGRLTKTGPGTLALSTAALNTYSGGTTVNAGTLSFLPGAAYAPAIAGGVITNGPFGTGAITLSGSGGLALNSANNFDTQIANNLLLAGGSVSLSMGATTGAPNNTQVVFANPATLSTPATAQITAPTIVAMSGGGNLAIRRIVTGAGNLTVRQTGGSGLVYDVQDGAAGQNNFSFGDAANTITLDSGWFAFRGNAPTAGNSNLTNNILVTANGGNLEGFGGANPTFTGTIALGGVMGIGAVGTANTYAAYTGQISIDQSAIGLRGFVTGRGNSDNGGLISGNIVDGAGTAHNPLVLRTSTGPGNANMVTIAGTNTYSGGTVVDETGAWQNGAQGIGINIVAAGSSLGTGNLQLTPGGRIKLNAAGNLAAGAIVSMSSNSTDLPILAVGYNGLPAISSTSSGVIGLGKAAAGGSLTFNAVSDIATVGNGRMYFGAVSQATPPTLAGTLLPGLPDAAAPTVGVYRFAGGWASEDGVYNAMPQLTVSATLSDRDGAHPSAIQVGVLAGNAWGGMGNVNITGTANTFTGPITVTGGWSAAGGLDVKLLGALQSSTNGTPLGAASGDVYLRNAQWTVNAGSAAGSLTKNNLTYDGASVLTVKATGGTQTDLHLNALVRTAGSQLQVVGGTNTLGTAERVLIDGPPPTLASNNSMMDASVMTVSNGTNFATYDAVKGIIPVTYSPNTLATSTSNDVVSTAGAALTGPASAYALKSTAGISGGSLTLGDGIHTTGLYYTGGISTPITINAPELIMEKGSSNVISGVISGGANLTINGGMINSSLNSFVGTVTLNGVYADTIPSDTVNASGNPTTSTSGFGNPGNPIVVNGAQLTQSNINSTRVLTIGPGGMRYSSGTLWCNIQGSGVLENAQNNNGGGAAVILAGLNNTWTGGFRINANGGSLTVNANSSVGHGDLTVGGGGNTATLLGDNNLYATAKADVALGGTINFQSAAPTFGNIQGAGTIILGTAGSTTNLTLGGDNSSSDFFGTITEVASLKGSLTKTGTGTLRLAGPNIYTGGTTVSGGGTLQVDGSIATGATVTGSTISGNGVIAGLTTVDAAGTVTPGAAGVGKLTLNGLTTVAGTKIAFAPGSAANSSLLNVSSGVLTSPAGSPLSINPAPGFGANTFNLISYTSKSAGASFVLATGAGTSILTGGGSSTGYYYHDYDVALVDNGTSPVQLTSVLTSPANLSQWSPASGGLWATPGNWTRAFAPGIGDTARFGAHLTSSGIIDLGGADQAVSNISFDNAGASYTLGANATIKLVLDTAGGGASSVAVLSGNHSIAAPVVLKNAADFSAATGGSLNVTGGVSGSGSLSLSGSGDVSIVNADQAASGNAITVNAGGNRTLGGSASAASSFSGNVTLNRNVTLSQVAFGSLTFSGQFSGAGKTATLTGDGNFNIVTAAAAVNDANFIVEPGFGMRTLGGSNASGTAQFTGNVTLNQDATFTAASGGAADFSGQISGPGTATLSGNGNVNVLAASTAVNNANFTVDAGAGTRTLGGSNTSGTALFTGIVTLYKDATLTAASGGAATFSGPINGAGTATLSGAGNVNVVTASAGVNNANFIVGTGAGTRTLGGSNTSGTALFTGNVTLNKDVILTAANGGAADFIGAWSVTNENLTVTGAGTSVVNLSSPLSTTGTVSVSSGALDIKSTLTSGDVANAGSFTVDTMGNATVGNLSGLGTTTVGGSLSAASIVQNTLTIGSGGTVTIRETTGGSVNAVPEPGTWVLLLAGAAGLLAFARRRRSR